MVCHMSEYRIQVQNLNVTIDNKKILNDISVNVKKGEIFTIIGPSGAGKSIFLRTLNRLLEPESGKILLDGNSILTMDPRMVRKKVGMVFQLPILFPGTVEDNILTGPRIWDGTKITKEETNENGLGQGGRGDKTNRISNHHGETLERMVENLLKSVDLPSDYAKQDAGKLSVGEQQRVCISRAIANDPEVILMDEPTASLDPESTHKIETLIKKLNRELGLTVVIVTHNMKQARKIGDTTMLLEKGQVVQVGPTSDHFPGFKDPTHECCIPGAKACNGED